MRIGLIVDGDAEFRSVGDLVRKVAGPNIFIGPLYADLQPLAPPGQIVRAARARLQILAQKATERVVVLLDLEGRGECPPDWARELEQRFIRDCPDARIREIKVVIKVRRYENWLVSDPAALGRLPGRFEVSNASRNQIAPNKADNAPAAAILKASILRGEYDKVRDAIRIVRVMDPVVGGQNSRSLRRFFRVIGDPRYAHQSRNP